jgi:hypothetical protein
MTSSSVKPPWRFFFNIEQVLVWMPPRSSDDTRRTRSPKEEVTTLSELEPAFDGLSSAVFIDSLPCLQSHFVVGKKSRSFWPFPAFGLWPAKSVCRKQLRTHEVWRWSRIKSAAKLSDESPVRACGFAWRPLLFRDEREGRGIGL